VPMGFSYALETGWMPPVNGRGPQTPVPHMAEGDKLQALLVFRADQLEGCAEGSSEEIELAVIADALEKYEAKRWPSGRVTGGKE
jgi:hypothetical protein